jgi:hypothetical protein
MEREAERSMESTDIDSIVAQVPEANSPANSESSSSSSDSSADSDAMTDLDSMTYTASDQASAELPDCAKIEPEMTASPDVTQNHCSELNGLITLTTTTTTTSSTDSVSCSPPPSDPDEDDIQDLQGDESDVQGTIDSYAPEERMHSLYDSNSQITAVLQNSSASLWRQFDALHTEMIVTRRGRYVVDTCMCTCASVYVQYGTCMHAACSVCWLYMQ